MHLYIITRGIKWATERFKNELGAKYLPFKYKGKDVAVQTAVRPIELLEVVFPKEHKDIMLNSVLLPSREVKHKKHKKWVTAIRKVLGVQKIPEYSREQAFPIFKEHIDITAIGVKDDDDFGEGDKKYEGL